MYSLLLRRNLLQDNSTIPNVASHTLGRNGSSHKEICKGRHMFAPTNKGCPNKGCPNEGWPLTMQNQQTTCCHNCFHVLPMPPLSCWYPTQQQDEHCVWQSVHIHKRHRTTYPLVPPSLQTQLPDITCYYPHQTSWLQPHLDGRHVSILHLCTLPPHYSQRSDSS